MSGLPAPTTPIAPVALTAQGIACATGVGLASYANALRQNRSALQPNHWSRVPLPTWIGRAPGVEDTTLPAALADWDCRATRLAWLGLQADDFITAAHAARQRHGATRVGLVLGTSASTIGASEMAYRTPAADGGFPAALAHERLHTLHAVADFVQQLLGLQGPCCTVSTACSSSAKAFAQAERWLRLGLVDAVVVGGVDALCESVLFGFHALQLVSPEPCRPFDARRSGISTGEAAAFALLEHGAGPVRLLGWGEANDAHHMSSPHPQGRGAERALDDALARAGLDAEAIDYLNLHGTASARNDEVEAALVARRYARGVHASATKGLTGHAMGAAGMVEALACVLALRDGLCSGSAGTAEADPALGPDFGACLQLQARQRPVRHAASHSFGFGGNNCVLIFGAGH
jgi:3-oxoacyl-[acyl-carrier-protein] synthase-1